MAPIKAVCKQKRARAGNISQLPEQPTALFTTPIAIMLMPMVIILSMIPTIVPILIVVMVVVKVVRGHACGHGRHRVHRCQRLLWAARSSGGHDSRTLECMEAGSHFR